MPPKMVRRLSVFDLRHDNEQTSPWIAHWKHKQARDKGGGYGGAVSVVSRSSKWRLAASK